MGSITTVEVTSDVISGCQWHAQHAISGHAAHVYAGGSSATALLLDPTVPTRFILNGAKLNINMAKGRYIYVLDFTLHFS